MGVVPLGDFRTASNLSNSGAGYVSDVRDTTEDFPDTSSVRPIYEYSERRLCTAGHFVAYLTDGTLG